MWPQIPIGQKSNAIRKGKKGLRQLSEHMKALQLNLWVTEGWNCRLAVGFSSLCIQLPLWLGCQAQVSVYMHHSRATPTPSEPGDLKFLPHSFCLCSSPVCSYNFQVINSKDCICLMLITEMSLHNLWKAGENAQDTDSRGNSVGKRIFIIWRTDKTGISQSLRFTLTEIPCLP